MRAEVRRLHALGPLPAEGEATEGGLAAHQAALEAIARPLSDEEGRLLMESFGPDGCFGGAWTLLHLIETSHASLTMAEPPEGANAWVRLLWERAERGRARVTRH